MQTANDRRKLASSVTTIVAIAMKLKKSSPGAIAWRQKKNWSATTSRPAFHNIEGHTGRRPRGPVANATPKPVAKKKMTGAKLPRNTAAPLSDVLASAG